MDRNQIAKWFKEPSKMANKYSLHAIYFCTGCGMCYRSCPVKTIVPDSGKYRIVQDGCVTCMCCHELCPEDAVEIRLSWLARKWS